MPVDRSVASFWKRSLNGAVVIFTLPPVICCHSSAWRCSGSAMGGPVNVMTLTVTPLKSLAAALPDALGEAAELALALAFALALALGLAAAVAACDGDELAVLVPQALATSARIGSASNGLRLINDMLLGLLSNPGSHCRLVPTAVRSRAATSVATESSTPVDQAKLFRATPPRWPAHRGMRSRLERRASSEERCRYADPPGRRSAG